MRSVRPKSKWCARHVCMEARHQGPGDFGNSKRHTIATFDANGKYTNSTDGTSHAAIYVGQDAAGLQVWDQWTAQPVHQRTIRFQGGAAGVKPVNDGDAFYVIE